jgi:hypothetical protein
LEAAESARSEIEQRTSGGGSSYEKMLQFAAAKRQGLGREDAMSLMKMSREQIQAGGFAVESLMQSTGASSIDELLEKKNKMGEYALTRTGKEQDLMEKARGATDTAQGLMGQGKFATNINDLKEAIANEKDPEKKKQLEAALSTQGAFEKYKMANFTSGQPGTDAESSAVRAGIFNYGETRDLSKAAPTRAATTFETSQMGQAKSEQAMMENANKYIKDYAESAKSVATSSAAFLNAFDNLTEALKNKSKNVEEIAKETLTVLDKQNARGSVRAGSSVPKPSKR